MKKFGSKQILLEFHTTIFFMRLLREGLIQHLGMNQNQLRLNLSFILIFILLFKLLFKKKKKANN